MPPMSKGTGRPNSYLDKEKKNSLFKRRTKLITDIEFCRMERERDRPFDGKKYYRELENQYRDELSVVEEQIANTTSLSV